MMVVEQSKRRRWSNEEWCAVQARYASSGLPLRTFCLREGINLSSFYRWRERCVDAPPRVQKTDRAVPAIRTRPTLPVREAAEFVDLGQLHFRTISRIVA
jgi:transposase-like protein